MRPDKYTYVTHNYTYIDKPRPRIFLKKKRKKKGASSLELRVMPHAEINSGTEDLYVV